jgi:OOP family OmpA-OmpF porin
MIGIAASAVSRAGTFRARQTVNNNRAGTTVVCQPAWRTVMRAFAIVLPVLGALAGTPAWADPAYDSREVVDFFAGQLGKPRAICIGTQDECGKAAEAAEVKPFDLLVTFEFNSDTLTPEAQANLDQFAEALRDERLSKARFAVEGHTDATGSEQYNLGLSDRRARAVVAYLTEKGLPEDRFVAEGFGKSRPRVSDPYDPGNRRVETRLTDW